MKRWHKLALAGSAVTILVVSVIVITLIGINSWFEQNRLVFRAPIEIRFNTPISVAKRETPKDVKEQVAEAKKTGIIVPTADAADFKQPDGDTSKAGIIASSKYPELIDYIWMKETTRGQNNTQDPTALHQYCKNLGKSNEFGFNPFNKQCFETFQDAVARVERWLDEHEELSDRQKLCYYNVGHKIEDCDYLAQL